MKTSAGFEPLAFSRTNVNIIVAQPPTYTNYASYLAPSLQTAYDFSSVKKRIKAILLSNPSNPPGRCYPRNVLIESLEFCQERGLHLICDELDVLTDLGHVKKGEAFVSGLSLTNPFMPEGAIKVDTSRVHVIWSASKLFDVSGLKVESLIPEVPGILLTYVELFVSQHNSELIRAIVLHDHSYKHHLVGVSFSPALVATTTNPTLAQL